MKFPLIFPTLIILSSIFSPRSTAQDPGFRCRSPTSATCNSLIDYKLPNTNTLDAITTLFQIKNLRSLLAANNLPINTSKATEYKASEILKIPFPYLCSNGTESPTAAPSTSWFLKTGCSISTDVFSRLVTFPQIQRVNNIPNADNISVGQRLWIPLPCSCDDVEGEPVLHYGYLVPAGSSVLGIAQQFNPTEATLLDLNGMNSSSELLADSIFDVPLKVCKTSVRNDSIDYPLLVPNDTYIFTANNCVRCECSAANNWILNCEPAGIQRRNGGTCPSMQCAGTSFDLGNTTLDSTCSLSRCAYGGYANNTIYIALTQESTCPGGSGNNSSASGGGGIGAKGLRWIFVLAASFIGLYLLWL